MLIQMFLAADEKLGWWVITLTACIIEMVCNLFLRETLVQWSSKTLKAPSDKKVLTAVFGERWLFNPVTLYILSSQLWWQLDLMIESYPENIEISMCSNIPRFNKQFLTFVNQKTSKIIIRITGDQCDTPSHNQSS